MNLTLHIGYWIIPSLITVLLLSWILFDKEFEGFGAIFVLFPLLLIAITWAVYFGILALVG